MKKYNNGDRIIMTKDYAFAKIGMIGTIRGYYENYAIEFDEGFPDGHHCCGLIKSRRGHWVTEDCFELYHEDKIEVGDKVEFVRTMGRIKKGFKGIIKGKTTLFDVVLTDCGSYSNRGYIWRVSRSDIRLIEKCTKPIKQQNWNISITPNGDKTTLSLTVDGEKKEYTVKRYEEDTYSIEASVKALVDKAFKKEIIEKKPELYLEDNKFKFSTYVGKIGTPTKYHDKNGKQLFVGDVVKSYDSYSGKDIYNGYVIGTCENNYIDGMKFYCDSETGVIKNRTVEKVKDYSMAKIGDRLDYIKVVSK